MDLVKEKIAKTQNAPVILLFGGSPERRHQVVNLISEVGDVTIHGALSEEEGIQFLKELTKVDLVLIGGAYSHEQRTRIREYLGYHNPSSKLTEPGIQYKYSNENIKKDIKHKLGLS